jgi:hypothetical protein
MLIFRRIFLSNYWWQKSDICSQASYRYPISWEAFLDLSDSYFLFAEERGYHRWALAHSSSCYSLVFIIFINFFGQLKDWVGQVLFLVSCPKGQVEKYVNVEAWVCGRRLCIRSCLLHELTASQVVAIFTWSDTGSHNGLLDLIQSLVPTHYVCNGYLWVKITTSCLFVCLMVFNATFNNISFISWQSVLLVEETGWPGQYHRPVASHWQTLSRNVLHLTLIKIWTQNISGDRHWLHR